MRILTNVKIHEAKGPRLPFRPEEAEIRDNELVYLTGDAIAVFDGEGILYWVDIMVTTDGGSARIYDNNAASGNTLAVGYAAKAPDSLLKNYDPPKLYKYGIYVDQTNALVEICYKPYARNLRCRVTKADTLRFLYSRLTVRKVVVNSTTLIHGHLLSRVEVEREVAPTLKYTRALVSRTTIRKNTTRAFVSRATTRINWTITGKARNTLQARVHIF